MNIDLSQYSSVISDRELGGRIFQDISRSVEENELITIDLSGVIVMTTYCAKQIFGNLFLKLGQDEFYRRISFRGATKDFKIIIQESIQSSIEDGNA